MVSGPPVIRGGDKPRPYGSETKDAVAAIPVIPSLSLKGGFGMDRLPSGDVGANAMHFAIGIMTYNLFLAQRLLTMPADWCTKTIKSIRWCLIEVGGKLI